MLNYESAYGCYPPSAPLKKTDPIQLSWRVQILPYIEQQSLYEEFKLNEPWDSPNNMKLIDRMPKLYQSPLAIAPPGQTYYKVFSGGGAIFEPGKKTRMTEIRDGISNTILAVEGGDSVIWTKPDDIPFDPKKPLPNLSLMGNRRINIAMADGSVRNIDLDRVSEKTLKALITMAGGEAIEMEGIEP
jgi:prepilin-type processing-associated H-X9-DG protein